MTVTPPPAADVLLQHADFVRAVARSLLGDGPDADDVAQETWVRALQRPPADAHNPRGWLATVARNVVRMGRRSSARRHVRERAAARPDGVPGAADVAERFEIQARVVDAVRALAEPYRTVVLLRYFEDLEPRHIAARLDIPVATVKTRLQRALAQLRGTLDERFGDRRAWAAPLAGWVFTGSTPVSTAATVGVWFVSTRLKALIIALVLLGGGIWIVRESTRPGPGARRVAERSRTGAAPQRPSPDDATGGGGDLPTTGPVTSTGPAAGKTKTNTKDTVKVRLTVVANGRAVKDAVVNSRTTGNQGTATRGGGAQVDEFEPEADGTFDIDLPEGLATFFASHHEYGPAVKQVDLAGKEMRVTIELSAPRALTVLVVDGADAPVRDAHVILMAAGERDGLRGANIALQGLFEPDEDRDQPTPFMSKLLTCIEIADLLATQEGAEQPLYRMPPIPTDATGRAVLPGLPPGPIDAMVLHDDYIGARLRDLRAEGTHKVRLQSGGSVKVVARSLDGESTVGAYVEVIAAGAFSIPRGIARIDANGEAVVQNIKAGAYRVTVSREGTSFLLRGMGSDENEEAEKPVVLSRRTEVQTGKQTIVDFSVTTGCTVCGVMFDTDGDPVELAHVWICRTGSHETVRTTIEGDGSFVFTSVMPGAYEAFGGTLDGTLAKQSFRVDPGATRVEIALRPGTATLTGTVELADGTLAKDMKVLLVKKYRSGHFLDLDTDLTVLAGLAGRDSTDKQGTGQFTIRGLGPGAYRVLFGYDKTCCVEDIELREGEARSIRLRYDKRGLFRLRVHGIDAADKTVPTKLLLRGADGHYGLVHAFNLDTEPKSAHEFRLPRGRYRIVAHSSGFAAVQDRVVELKADRDVKLRFEPIRAFRLQLRRDGRPVANEAVDIRTEHGARAGLGSTLLDVVMTPTDFRTDEAGSITLTGLEQGLYRIRSGSRVIGEFRIDGEAENAVVELR